MKANKSDQQSKAHVIQSWTRERCMSNHVWLTARERCRKKFPPLKLSLMVSINGAAYYGSSYQPFRTFSTSFIYWLERWCINVLAPFSSTIYACPSPYRNLNFHRLVAISIQKPPLHFSIPQQTGQGSITYF